MSSANTFQGMARSISARNRSRRVTLRLPANSASEKLNWLIGVFLIASHSTSYILTGSSDLFRVSLVNSLSAKSESFRHNGTHAGEETTPDTIKNDAGT